jgi:hypothetical protein
MNITPEQMHVALMEYLESEIAAKATGLTKFASYFAITSLYNHPEKTIGLLTENPMVRLTNVINEDGTIRLDDAYAAARKAMDRCSNITVAGITFTASDIDKLYELAKRRI